jgi:light-regulated signal transduction histidine kinase (bacteriophytochrome)
MGGQKIDSNGRLRLALARKFVEMRGGRIGIKCMSDNKLCFCFTIPLRDLEKHE